MTTSTTDRRQGVNSSAAVKVACRAASTAALTRSGEQTVDGVALVTGDRVLVKDQASGVENGIYVVDTGDWSRALDFDGSYDARRGTLVFVHSGSTNQGWWYLSTSDPLTIGTTALTWTRSSTALAVISALMQTLLDDTTEAAARLTLGMSTVQVLTDSTAEGDGVTDDTTAIQTLLSGLPAGAIVDFPPAKVYILTDQLTGPAANVTLRLNGSELRWTSLGANKAGILQSANNLTIIGGKLTGPSAAAYVANEHGIKVAGTSSAARKSALTLYDVEITQFGSCGVSGKWTDDIRITDVCYIHDCGYGGAMFESCDNGYFVGNRIDNITPGTASNMYGISLTHDTTGYSADPDAGTKLADNPFCRGWTIAFNEISRIAWEGIDCHGAYEAHIVCNRIYATHHGIAVTESSGNADNYAGYSNVVVGNIIDARNKDGSTSGYENDSYGINVNGGGTVTHLRVVVQGNIILYKGIKLNSNVGAIQATLCKRLVCSSNVIDFWNGVAILATLAGGQISDNYFGQLAQSADTGSACVYDGGPTTRKLVVDGNMLDVEGGNAPDYGFLQIATATVRPTLSGNSFGGAGTPYSLSAGGFALGTDVTPRLAVAGSAGAIDIAALYGEDGVIDLTDNGTYTVTNFSNGVEGQTITVMKSGTGTVTVDRTNAALDGGTNKTLTGAYTLTLRKYGSVWRQVAYAQGS